MGTAIEHPVLEPQSARMSKITNDGLTRSGTAMSLWLHPQGNSGRQRVKPA